jgi:hypothetical protein
MINKNATINRVSTDLRIDDAVDPVSMVASLSIIVGAAEASTLGVAVSGNAAGVGESGIEVGVAVIGLFVSVDEISGLGVGVSGTNASSLR